MLHKKFVYTKFQIGDQETEGTLTFNATLSTTGNVDKMGDVIMHGAFGDWLKSEPDKIPMLWQHAKWNPIGYWDSIELRENQLTARGHLFKKTSQGHDAAVLIDGDVMEGVSVGFSSEGHELSDDKERAKKMGIDFKNISVHEASIVTFAANDQAGIKSEEDLSNRREMMYAQVLKHFNYGE